MEWMDQVYELASSDTPRKALGVIIENFDRLFEAAAFMEADEVCRAFDVERVNNTSVLVSLLMATFVAKDRLRGRGALIRRVEERLTELVPDRVASLLRTLR